MFEMRRVEPSDVVSPSATKEQMSSTTERKPSPTSSSSLDSAVSHYAYEHFDRRRQLRWLLTKSLARWLITVVLCASIYGVLLGYSSHDALPQRKKLEFNTLVIALTISLGLNIASSLKANAVELQWWLLSLRRYKPREADLIMSSEQFTTMLQLGWTTRHTLIQIFVVVFVTMNIVSDSLSVSRPRTLWLTVVPSPPIQGSQIALALLGITYNINPANHFAITKPGIVAIADLNDIQGSQVLAESKKRHETEDVNSRRYSANLYGQFGSTFAEDNLDLAPKPGALNKPELPQIFYSKEVPVDSDDGNNGDGSAPTKPNDDRNTYSYTYVFFESTVGNASYAGVVASNRSVTVTASCASYKVVAGGNGTSSNITVRFDYGEDIFYLPVANGGSQILYLHDPAIEANDTWSQVHAFEPSDTDPWFYTCQVSVGNVTNGFLPQHFMGTNFTRYIPPAIALQGYGASDSDIGLTNTTTNYQFQSYPLQTYFGWPASGSGVRMAALVSRCAINALAVGAVFSSTVDVPGMEPQRAIQLEITKWRYVHVILGLTAGVQLVIHLVAVLVANRVQVREQRSLATASLLRPLLAGVSERASMARGKQIAKLIGKDVTVRYEPVGAGYDLCIYRNGQLERFTPNTIDR